MEKGKKKCSVCAWWFTKPGDPTKGKCHRNPPAAGDRDIKDNFPRVDAGEFCGEFKS